MLGWAHWEVTEDEAAWSVLVPVVDLADFAHDLYDSAPKVYFARALFREAQSDIDLTLSKAALRTAVSE